MQGSFCAPELLFELLQPQSKRRHLLLLHPSLPRRPRYCLLLRCLPRLLITTHTRIGGGSSRSSSSRRRRRRLPLRRRRRLARELSLRLQVFLERLVLRQKKNKQNRSIVVITDYRLLCLYTGNSSQ